MRSSHYDTKIVPTLGPAVLDADTDGETIDRLGFETLAVGVMVGAGGDTFTSSKRIDFVLEESEDGETFTPVANEYVTGTTLDGNGAFLSLQAAHADPSATTISYTGYARYVRVQADFNGTHAAGTPISAVAMLGRAHERPVS